MDKSRQADDQLISGPKQVSTPVTSRSNFEERSGQVGAQDTWFNIQETSGSNFEGQAGARVIGKSNFDGSSRQVGVQVIELSDDEEEDEDFDIFG